MGFISLASTFISVAESFIDLQVSFIALASTLIIVADSFSEGFLAINSVFGSVISTQLGLNRTAIGLNYAEESSRPCEQSY